MYIVETVTLFVLLDFVDITILYYVFNENWWSTMQFLKYKMRQMQFYTLRIYTVIFPITIRYIPTTSKHRYQRKMSSILDILILKNF